MTPKEKAQELFDKYFEFVEALSASNQIDNAKQCAIITVDEIQNSRHLMIDIDDEKYWQEVKHELELL